MCFKLEDMGIRADSDIIQIKQTAGANRANPLMSLLVRAYCIGPGTVL
jgi:hypothetical protein